MKTPKDTDLREALRRKYAREPQLPANFTSRMMSQKKRRWLLPASALAIAASVLLLIIFNIEKPQPEQQTPVIAEKVMPPVPAISDEPIEHAKPTRPIKPVKVAKAATPKKRPIEAELPDTLGQSIFESEENVRIAMQILCECEATIRQEKQQTRNYIIEATFNALPHAEDAQLVRGENGDLEVIQVSQQTAIEI